MKYSIQHTEMFLKGLTDLTGLSYKKLQQYAEENNPFNVLEHPYIMEPNEKQLKKIELLNEFVSTYNLLKIHENGQKISLNSTTISGQYFSALLSGTKDKEKFMVAFLDSKHNIIETKIMFEGSIAQTVVYPREILKYALACDCKAMVIAHNHPGMSTEPSREDLMLTQKLIDIFHPLEIKVLDHIIVGGTKYSSMAETGVIPVLPMGRADYDVIVLDKGINDECLNSMSMSY